MYQGLLRYGAALWFSLRNLVSFGFIISFVNWPLRQDITK